MEEVCKGREQPREQSQPHACVRDGRRAAATIACIMSVAASRVCAGWKISQDASQSTSTMSQPHACVRDGRHWQDRAHGRPGVAASRVCAGWKEDDPLDVKDAKGRSLTRVCGMEVPQRVFPWLLMWSQPHACVRDGSHQWNPSP